MTATNIRCFFGGFLALMLFFKGVFSLKNVVLTIEPRVVQRLHHATLRCTYDLEDTPLYCVKWYRGHHEFYRYTPSELPDTKIFPLGGIIVDKNSSNSTQVVLRDIDFNLSGNFTCEVTTDETLSTREDTQAMLVVQLPESNPTINVGRDPLDVGHILRANCSSPPSWPPATLKFILNNITVARSDDISLRKIPEPEWSDLSLVLELSEFHFRSGRLILRCVAQVANEYIGEAELELDSARDPVPERVSAFDAANRVIYCQLQLIIVSCFLLFIYS